MSIMTLKVLIVDNERCERTSLVELCERRSDVQVIGEAESGVAALRAADELCPDVMLVDVKLPDMSGFDLVSATRGQGEFFSVIVTGGADSAEAALAAGALDYLLKPIDAVHLGRSLERAQLRCQSANTNPPFWRRLEAIGAHQPYRATRDQSPFLVGERQHRLYPLELEKIDYIEAHGNYVTIRSGNCDFIRRDSIKRLAAYLAERGFMRIERSVLLNVRAVVYAQMAGHGTFAFTLSSGACLQSSASYRDTILGVLPLVSPSRRSERHRPTRSGLKQPSDVAG